MDCSDGPSHNCIGPFHDSGSFLCVIPRRESRDFQYGYILCYFPCRERPRITFRNGKSRKQSPLVPQAKAGVIYECPTQEHFSCVALHSVTMHQDIISIFSAYFIGILINTLAYSQTWVRSIFYLIQLSPRKFWFDSTHDSQWLHKNWFKSTHNSKWISEIWFKSTHVSKSFQNCDSNQFMTNKTSESWFQSTCDSMMLFIPTYVLTSYDLVWAFYSSASSQQINLN